MNLSQSEDLMRKKILTLIGNDKQLISMAQVKLFTSTKETENSDNNLINNPDEWLFSNLEGNLCYILDFNTKSRYFKLFENTTFQLLFHMDIYHNFSNFYTVIDQIFHCFEINNIFIGLLFSDVNEAGNFSLMIKKLNDQIVQMMLDSNNMKIKESRKEKKKKFYENCEILKKNFGAENKYNRDYCDDGTEICKPVFYELLNFMSYNRDTKEFEVGSVPKEFKNLFKNMGIKKHQLKKADTTLKFFKYFIESFDLLESVNKRKISSLSDDEDDKSNNDNMSENTNDESLISKSEKSDLSNSTSTYNKQYEKDLSEGLSLIENSTNNIISLNSSIKSNNQDNYELKVVKPLGNFVIPKAPPLVINIPKGPIPPAPKLNLPTIINASNLAENNQNNIDKKTFLEKPPTDINPEKLPSKPTNFLHEITKGVVLKKVAVKEEKKLQVTVNSCLMSAIQMRGYQLNKNNVQNSDSSDDAWSD